jgi:hypothetical protein
MENLFPNALPLIENEHGYDYALCKAGIEEGKIVTGWQLIYCIDEINYDQDYDISDWTSSPTFSQKKTAPGTKGRLSLFALYENYLYAVDDY